MNFDKKYLVWALGYLMVGLCLGIFMASTQNHLQHVTHAHINLIGFVLSLVYGIIHKLWLGQPNPTLAKLQFILHQAGAVTISIGLFLLYGHFLAEPQIGPILGIASITILVSAALMFYMVLKTSAVRA